MGKSVRMVTLTSAITVALAGAVLQGVPNAYAATSDLSIAQGGTMAASNEKRTYIITFAEAGLLEYRGGVSQLAATAPNRAAGQRKLDVRSSAARAYENYLESQRAAYLTSINGAIGRKLDVAHSYSITQNGIAAEMTGAEAARIAQIDGVKSVEAERIERLDTYRGPTFIGANTIWNGDNTPGHVGTKGQGVTVGIIDGGTNNGHPSFANTSVDNCGFDDSHPKIVAVDCSTSTAGVCNGPNPEANPHYGHGVHTSSTVAGNTIGNADTPSPGLPDGVTSMSGVAPCAAIRQYKVCETDTCGGAAILAAIQNAITDQVDVINFSISGGTSPWSDNDRKFLDAVNADVFVTASAGNTSATVTNPVGQVNHRGPWVMTVAASTQDQKLSPELSVVGPDTPSPDIVGIALNPGSTTPWGAPPLSAAVIRTNPANIEGCSASGGFPANYFADGAIALVRRGTCNFSEKIDNAAGAGASIVIISNNQAAAFSMDTSAQTSSAFGFSISDQTTGDALIAYVNAHLPPAPDGDLIFADGFDGPAEPAPEATVDFNTAVLSSRQPDILADFSFRGPTPGTLADLTKPDITAPGVDIFAALDKEDGNYGLMSGTSMSGPHVAGSAALIRAAHPDWTVPEVKSALMMTATRAAGTKEDGTTPWNVDDVGSGRVDLTKAALAGLTMDETYANFLAANPSGGSINVKDLNLPALRNLSCTPDCTWTRTVKNRLTTSGSWTVTGPSDPAYSVTATPSTFTLAPGATQTVTFKATPSTNITAIKFGYINLHEASNAAPDQVITVAIKGQGAASTGYDLVIDQLGDPPASFNLLGSGTANPALQFMWLNRFSPQATDYPFTLTSIETIFGSQTSNGYDATVMGETVDFYIFQDSDNNPANGATLVGKVEGVPVSVQDAYQTISLPGAGITLTGSGDVLIAMVNRGRQGKYPASADVGPDQSRSYISKIYSGANSFPAGDPDLSTLQIVPITTALASFTYNWVIRGHGTRPNGAPVNLD